MMCEHDDTLIVFAQKQILVHVTIFHINGVCLKCGAYMAGTDRLIAGDDWNYEFWFNDIMDGLDIRWERCIPNA